MSTANKFYGIFILLLRKIGVAVGPNEIPSVKKQCEELVDEIRALAKEEALKVCLEHLTEIKEIVNKKEKPYKKAPSPYKPKKLPGVN